MCLYLVLVYNAYSCVHYFFFFEQNTAYEMRISDWSSDVCSSDLSCSWKIYVKGGIVTWETQQTVYPRTRPDLPNHEPRGCPRGASYSWYLYSGTRIKIGSASSRGRGRQYV